MMKSSAHVPRSVWRMLRLQPVRAAAAVVQVADINEGTTLTIISLQCIS